MEFLYLIFYACLRLQFLNVKTNPSSRRPVLSVCRLLCSNLLGLARNLSDLTVASCRYLILLCSETLISDMRHVGELLVPDLVALSCCAGARSFGPKGWSHTYVMDMKHFANPSFNVVVAVCCLLWFVVLNRTYMCSVSATLTGAFGCLLTSMAAVQAEDVRASFLFVGDLNCYQ